MDDITLKQLGYKKIPVIKLTIEMVPSTCWFSNVRSHVSPFIWQKLKRITFKKTYDECEICGGTGRNWPVECHEIWDYDDYTKTQTLKGLIALCPLCHAAKHYGLSKSKGREQEILNPLEKVNNISDSLNQHISINICKYGKKEANINGI